MSRIAGILPERSDENVSALLATLLQSCKSSADWNLKSSHIGRAGLGAVSWKAPLSVQQGNVVAVVDGVFFNRSELPSHGNEAAILIQLYRQHGFVDALTKINGDFALALYDADNDELWLGRDRTGAKPLFYASSPGYFAFASRPRALFRAPGVSSAPRREFVALFAAAHYRYFDNNPEASPYEDIAQLPAGCALRVKNGSITRHRYWELEELPGWTGTEETLAEQYRDLLLDATCLRVQAAHRPAFTLSGGMDSSTVLSCAVHTSGQKQQAISTVYEDKTYDEREDIQTILDDTVSKWHTISVGTPDVFSTVQRMTAVHDEPVATATWLSHFLLCEYAAGEGFEGLFGGLGGDEMNAGEFEYFWYHFADLKTNSQEKQLTHEIDQWIKYHDHPVFKKSHQLVGSELPAMADLSIPGRCLPERKRLTRYYKTLHQDYFPIEKFEPVLDHPFTSYLKNRTYQDIFRETAPCCLRAQDRHATEFHIDNFLPFFDHRIIEFMFRVPGSMKIRDGVTKRLLREATKGILPESTRSRVAKTGWNAPAHVWFSGEGRDSLMDLIASQTFRQRGVYNVPEVERLVSEHNEIMESGKAVENHMMFLWQLVNLELWLQQLDAS